MEHTKRQREILTASLELLAAGGMARLTIRNLAEKLGITEPAIYRHFRNKSEIIRTLIGEFDRGIPDQTGESSGFEAVARFIRSRIAQVAEQPPLAKVVFSEELFLEEPDFSRLLEDALRKVRYFLLPGIFWPVYSADFRRTGYFSARFPAIPTLLAIGNFEQAVLQK